MSDDRPSVVADTYEHAPLLLNLVRDGASGEWALGSTWCNLGLWPSAPDHAAPCTFGRACEALAVALGEAARLGRGDAVLDVGVGYADQTALWATHFGVRRVLAVELSAAHVAAAREAQRAGRLAGGDVVELRVGSAADVDDLLAAEEHGTASFDAALCLDCAYHFRTRARFLASAAKALRPGGRFAAVDLVAAPPPAQTAALSPAWVPARWRAAWRRCARRAVALLCDIPAANLHGADEYAEALQAAGMAEVRIEVLTPRVLAPFAAHATRQRRALGAHATWSHALFLRLIAALFAWVARDELFDVVLVTAVRTS
jgi:SAM-dependent methyltransferase